MRDPYFSLGPIHHTPFYSATSIFAVLRNLLREIWLEKSGSWKVVDQKKRWFYTINLPFFLFEKNGWPEKKIQVCRTTFLERWRKVVREIWFEKSGWPEKKNLSLKNHFSRTTFLHFSRKVVAEKMVQYVPVWPKIYS